MHPTSDCKVGTLLDQTPHTSPQRYYLTIPVRIGNVVHHNVQTSFGHGGFNHTFKDGLLGMSILKYYIVDIDLIREELHLIPRIQ